MKIFFNASLTGKKVYGVQYGKINELLSQQSGCTVNSPVTKGDVAKVVLETTVDAENYYTKLLRWIKSADICIFEVSYPSLGIGHEITLALHFGKPVIALFIKGKNPYIFEGIPDDKLQVLEYQNEDLKALIPSAIAYATEQVDTRFNFFISPQIGNYLDWVAKRKRVPRAVYLRRLIEEDMRNSKEYEKGS